MINIIRYKDLGNADYGWLNAHYHFSFSHYYNPERMSFGKIRVINDDIIQPKSGFPTHAHDNMEIITYVRQGAITHEDNQGNKGRTAAGDIQVMSAGHGITHSEYNLEDTETRLYQIWIEPRELNVDPAWAAHEFPKGPVTDALPLLVSGDGTAPLHIHADARIFGGVIDADQKLTHKTAGSTYILVSSGQVDLNGQTLRMGDAAEITDESEIIFQTLDQGAEILLIET